MASFASQLSSRRLARADARLGRGDLKAEVAGLIDSDERFAQRLRTMIDEYKKEFALVPISGAEEEQGSVPVDISPAPASQAGHADGTEIQAAEAQAKADYRRKQQQAVIDLDRYAKPMSIWAALMTGHVRLVKMSWLIAFHEAGGVLPHRQALPAEAFMSIDELKGEYGDGNEDGVLPIIAISFCWDTPAHPDPHGKQLATVAAMLKREKSKYARANGSFKGFSDMGVFWVRARDRVHMHSV